MRLILLLLFGSAFLPFASSQINLTAGYRAAFVEADIFNEIIATHVENVESGFSEGSVSYNYTDAFGDLSYLNGFELGARYITPVAFFGIGWRNKRRQLRAQGRNSGNSRFENTISTSIHSVSAGIHPRIWKFSLGATVDYNWLKLISNFEQPGFTVTSRDHAWSSHFSLSYNLGSDSMIGVTIQPYWQIYWSDFDLAGFQQTIDPGGSPPAGGTNERFNTFGIAIIVNNGPQPRN